MSRAPAIGIDLGTSNSCVAVFQHGKVEVIPNDHGNRTTPSYVAFTDSGRLVGDLAKNQVNTNPSNTIFDSKRLVGHMKADSAVVSDAKYWPFDLVDRNGRPNVKVLYKGKEKLLFTEEILAMVVHKMKTVAESYLGMSVTDAVVAVPAMFNDSQRQATKDACEIAGLNTLRLISEPIAAAVAYGVDKKVGAEKNVLILDLGSGFLSISVLTIEDGIFEVKAVSGDTHFGGEDFTRRMVDHFVYEFQSMYKKDLTRSKRAVQRLRNTCEKAKRSLSTNNEARLEIDSLFEDIDFYTKITRERFEELNADLFRCILDPLEKALRDSKLSKEAINDIVLVGGSTRVPKIQQLMHEFFDRKNINKSMNPDEAVACGAAIHAAILSGDRSEEVQDLLLLDVTAYSLGIQTTGGVMTALIKRNSNLPKKETQIFTTSQDNQKMIPIEVFEGEHAMVKDNTFLGKFELKGIPPAPSAVPQIEVTFDIDRNGILNVSAADKSTGKESKITITNDHARLSVDDIERMINDAVKYQAEEDRERERIAAMDGLESYALSTKSTMEDSISQMKKIIKKCEEVTVWLDENQSAAKDQFELQMKELMKTVEKFQCH